MIVQAVLPARPGVFVAVTPNPFAQPPYDGRPWSVFLYELDSFDPDYQEFDDVDSARQWAEREYGITPDAWMKGEQAGSPLTLARIVAGLWNRTIEEDELQAAVRLAYSQLPLDEHGLTIWPSAQRSVITYRAICYGFFEELDALRGPTFEPLAPLGYDYVLRPAGDVRIDETDVFARLKGAITRAGRISGWLSLEERG